MGVFKSRSDERGKPGTEYTIAVVDFFRTEQGKTLRMEESDEGAPRVEILKQGIWMSAPRGMFGLRLSRGTHRLTSAEVLTLPLQAPASVDASSATV